MLRKGCGVAMIQGLQRKEATAVMHPPDPSVCRLSDTMHRPLIIAIEDDAAIRALLAEVLVPEGFELLTADSVGAFERTDTGDAVLYLVDLSLPDGHGFPLLHRLRQRTNAGIVVLTGQTGESEQVLGLELGADDYIAKPFRPRELVARINAVLRRIAPEPPGAPAPGAAPAADHAFGPYRVNRAARRVFTVAGEDIALTTAEFDLLAALLNQRGTTLNRDQIIRLIKGREWEAHHRAIDGLVSRVRRKLPQPAGAPPYIRTIHGIGYAFIG